MSTSKQTRKNLVLNLISLFVSIGLGIFYTPYLVKSLGIIAYGIVPLALIVNQYINAITGSLTGSLTRFYSVSLEQQKKQEASKYLSSSFVAIAVFITVMSPFLIWIVVNVDSLFNIPIKHIGEAKILFLFTFLSFILSLFSSLLNITLYALNRLDLLNVIKIIRIGVKFFFTVAFFEAFSKSIMFIGYANFLSELCVLIISIWYFINNNKNNIKISLRFFEFSALTSVLSMTLWVIIHQVGDTSIYRIDNILVNIYWSTKESGILGALSDLGNYILMTVLVVASLFGPLILIAYSKGDHELVKKLTLRNSLLVGVLTSLLVGLLIGFAKPIISLWIGKEYIAYINWFILKLIPLPFYAASGIFAFVFRAWNRVYVPALVTVLIGLINLVASICICSAGEGNVNYISVMLITSVFLIICQSYILNALIFCKLYPEVKSTTIFKGFFQIFLILIMTSTITAAYSFYVPVNNIFQLLIGLFINSILSGITVFFIILRDSERTLIINNIIRITNNYKNI